ncbi:MAG TPA: hypothetical protein VGI92_05095 [Gemmatimonadales bacterium]
MPNRRALAPPWRVWFRRHERALSLVYLGLVAVACLAMAAGPTRRIFLNGLQGISDRVDQQWDRRLGEGRRMVAAGKYAEAVPYLERLDRSFPAPSPQHARDRQREEILRLLATSFEKSGHKKEAMAVYDRLIAFDPRDYVNIALKAAAARRMLSGWAIAAEAKAAWDSTLKVFPNHLPSVRGVIDFHSDRGEFIPIAAAYRAYLNAFLVDHVRLRVGPASYDFPVLVDGRAHTLLVSLPSGQADSAELWSAGFAMALDTADVTSAAEVGSARTATTIVIPATAITPLRMVRTSGAWRPNGDSASLRLALPQHSGGGQLRLVLRLFKPIDDDTWGVVSHAYLQLLDSANLRDDQARTVTFATARDADAVLAHLPWAAPEGFDLSGGK